MKRRTVSMTSARSVCAIAASAAARSASRNPDALAALAAQLHGLREHREEVESRRRPGSGSGVQDQDPNVQFSERTSTVGFGHAPADSAALLAASRLAWADWRPGDRASTADTACSTVIVAGEPAGTA